MVTRQAFRKVGELRDSLFIRLTEELKDIKSDKKGTGTYVRVMEVDGEKGIFITKVVEK